jgi:hypothetical protein
MPLSTERFREEASSRLIDTWELMLLLGLRNKQSVHDRVKAGKLPPPVVQRDRNFALWDKNAIVLPD